MCTATWAGTAKNQLSQFEFFINEPTTYYILNYDLKHLQLGKILLYFLINLHFLILEGKVETLAKPSFSIFLFPFLSHLVFKQRLSVCPFKNKERKNEKRKIKTELGINLKLLPLFV
jgi:hypothetical protein